MAFAETNIKLRMLADKLLLDYAELVYEEVLRSRETFDHLLLTAHQRIDHNGDTVEK